MTLGAYLERVEEIGKNLSEIRESIAENLEEGESEKEAAILAIHESVESLMGFMISIALYVGE